MNNYCSSLFVCFNRYVGHSVIKLCITAWFCYAQHNKYTLNNAWPCGVNWRHILNVNLPFIR
jgi:hypothetical protein